MIKYICDNCGKEFKLTEKKANSLSSPVPSNFYYFHNWAGVDFQCCSDECAFQYADGRAISNFLGEVKCSETR